MTRVLLCIFPILLAGTCISGQKSSTATASVSADIIIPVGTTQSGDRISGTFYPLKEPGTIVVNRNGIAVSGQTGLTDQIKEASIPSFHVTANQYAYSISLSFDSPLISSEKGNETMLVESLTLESLIEKNTGAPVADSYSTGAIFRAGPSQAPGKYSSPHPCRITINFN